MAYDVVLFDLDHTLLDSDASQAAAYERTMRSIGVDEPAAVFATFDAINQALWRAVERHELSPNEVKTIRFRRLLDELGVEGDPERMADEFVAGLAEEGELYPGALDLLHGLGRRSRLAVVTNGIGSVQRGRLRRLGLDDVFEVVTISGEVGVNKPGSEIFDIAFDELGVADRSTSVMIGDNLGSDIAGGRNAGIDTIWYNPNEADNAGDVVPTHVVRNLAEIADLI